MAETTRQRLPIITKLAFGAGDMGPAIVTNINGFFLNAFLLQVARLEPVSVGIIFLVAKIWDSINDPIFGWLTDHTPTHWGRRRPWLLFGAIPFGLAFWMHWLVPPLGDVGKFWYYLVVAILLDTGFTAVNVPYTALTAELTPDYDERTSLNTYRFGFSIISSVIAAVLHLQIVSAIGDPVMGNAISAGVWAFFIIIPSFITFAFTKETHFKQSEENEIPFIEGLKTAFSNRAFVMVTLIYLLSWLCIQFVQNNLYLYVQYWIGPEAAKMFSILVMGVQLAAFVFIVIWAKVSEKIGKQGVYYVGMAFWVLVEIALFFIPRGEASINLLYIIAPLAGVGVAVGYLIPWSMLPDVIELDELETGQRREGTFYGFFVLLQKLGISIGIAFSNFALAAAGYNAELAAQPDSVLTTLRVFISLVPAVILLLSFLVVRVYPITRAKHAEIRAQLAARNAK